MRYIKVKEFPLPPLSLTEMKCILNDMKDRVTYASFFTPSFPCNSNFQFSPRSVLFCLLNNPQIFMLLLALSISYPNNCLFSAHCSGLLTELLKSTWAPVVFNTVGGSFQDTFFITRLSDSKHVRSLSGL